MKKLRGNVVRDNDIASRMSEVFDYVGNAVANTYGPLGHTTLIQNTTGVTATKDGWTVLQNITLDNVFDNSIKMMIEACAFAVVLLVGDGTTTVTNVSALLNKSIREFRKKHPELTIRDLESLLTNMVDRIVDELRKNATPIDETNLKSAIKNVALVSTNWDEELSEMIAEIYDKTKNPVIKVETSGTTNTEYQIIDGYDLVSTMLVEGFYITDPENKICEVENPVIMMFDYKVPKKYFNALYAMSGWLASSGKRMVVLAPDFDKALIDQINAVNIEASRRSLPFVNFIPVQLASNFNIDRECIKDFSIMVGAKLITKVDEDVNEFLDDVAKVSSTKLDENDEHYEENKQYKEMIISAVPEYLDSICGTCEKMRIFEKYLLIDGINNADEKLLKERKDMLDGEITKKIKDCSTNNYLTDDIRQKRIRLGKLQGKMGLIKIGGFGDANVRARKDALEDATRACEAAYRDGYTAGSCVSTCRAIGNLIEYGEDNEWTDAELDLLGLFLDAYYDTFLKLFENGGYKDTDTVMVEDEPLTVNAIYSKCLEKGCAFDIINMEFDESNTKIINPVNVDIEVLRGCLRLLITSVTSNQFLFKNYQGFDMYEENSSSEEVVSDVVTRYLNDGE